eukprot:gnl/MRDRNA2_/MRDRNA2_121457_c0_seq1.p2 gnl/MRDRNA2_/MRDRNA2_121457_c0~~gnl/MRDRNA2_/MRDRNA2_121457_c0_seq1.p2  ORF type:complete len:108 (+),score=19.33 gnl/MRDRNA2_/MRDRNA2_121457_c0_seq1:575-898(+)
MDFNGYHPSNKQARAFSFAKAGKCHEDVHRYHAVDTDRTISNMKKIKFVGITEHYQESMSLFFDKAQPEAAMPKWCGSKSSEWSKFNAQHDIIDIHGMKLHSVKDMS